MAYGPGYLSGYNDASAAARARASANIPSGNRNVFAEQRAAEEAAEKERQTQAEIKGLQGQILDLKGRLVSTRAVREALRTALRQVAPDHPYVNNPAGTGNERLIAISDQAAASVKRWDDKV